MRKTRLQVVLNRGPRLRTYGWLVEVVELDCMEVGRSVVVFVIVAKSDVEVNGPPGAM
jgi:hypothetical protein